MKVNCTNTSNHVNGELMNSQRQTYAPAPRPSNNVNGEHTDSHGKHENKKTSTMNHPNGKQKGSQRQMGGATPNQRVSGSRAPQRSEHVERQHQHKATHLKEERVREIKKPPWNQKKEEKEKK